MIVTRTESHIVKRSNLYYKLLKQKCHIAKNIYNQGNYLIRQEFLNNGNYLSYQQIEKLLHDDENSNYWDLGMANSSQQVLRVLDKNWKSFFRSIKDWSKHPEKYTGKPKLPRYLRKDGYKEFALTTNQAKLKDGFVHFPKVLQGFKLKTKFSDRKDFVEFRQARIIPRNDCTIVELIYSIDIDIKTASEHKNIGSIDLGIDNFVTFVNNLGNKPIIINGKGLKSKNKYYNEIVAKHKSILDLNSNSGYSHKLYSIINKRNNFVKYFMHCSSKYIVNLCLERNITCIVVGKNKQWKTKSTLSKLVNQTFVQIPYNSFIEKLKYKCEAVGITVIEVEESYTSGTSFLDNELPTKENYNKSRRIKRGLFKSNKGLINADVNAACQIMRKVFTDAFKLSDRGWVGQPIRINIC